MKFPSYKALKQMHKDLGGNTNGFYVVQFGHDVLTRKTVVTLSTIGFHTPAQANWSYQLVRGRYSDN